MLYKICADLKAIGGMYKCVRGMYKCIVYLSDLYVYSWYPRFTPTAYLCKPPIQAKNSPPHFSQS